MKLRRLTSLLVAGCMMVSMLPASAVTAFAETASDTSVSASESITTYEQLKNAIENASDGATITVDADIDVKQTLVVTKQLTLDLNGKKLFNSEDLWDKPTEEDHNWSLISVRENGELTITGNGTLKAKENDCYPVDVQDGAKLTIENGTFIGNIHAVYVQKGEATINGGHFSVQQKYPSADKADEFVLNLYDANRANGTAKMTVTGGKFENFNPENCWAEGAGTNFCATGYISKDNGDNTYTVERRTYHVDADTDVDETPDVPDDEKDPDAVGTVNEPVQITVTATGEDVKYIKTLTLDFGNDIDAVRAVEIKKGDKTFDLSAYKAQQYKDMVIQGLFDDTEENEAAVQAAENADLSFDLRVTYTENGIHHVNIVFKDAEGEDGAVVAQTNADVQIGAQNNDDGDDTPSDSSGDGVGAVVAGVAIGTGVAVLTYHIGTELYAKQVLGAGVAVPSTREDVALKAWELAGKPAVAAEGETLSNTEQAERWVIESGLMQNDANGNFNGQKKMLKLAALRTLDAAKKLG